MRPAGCLGGGVCAAHCRKAACWKWRARVGWGPAELSSSGVQLAATGWLRLSCGRASLQFGARKREEQSNKKFAKRETHTHTHTQTDRQTHGSRAQTVENGEQRTENGEQRAKKTESKGQKSRAKKLPDFCLRSSKLPVGSVHLCASLCVSARLCRPEPVCCCLLSVFCFLANIVANLRAESVCAGELSAPHSKLLTLSARTTTEENRTLLNGRTGAPNRKPNGIGARQTSSSSPAPIFLPRLSACVWLPQTLANTQAKPLPLLSSRHSPLALSAQPQEGAPQASSLQPQASRPS